jgi:alkanesulfonate monooxygenase SsuD/methylene tetrahydromethanopterin reductase-like flavin-dependent oxidoreductase (luciferase family)
VSNCGFAPKSSQQRHVPIWIGGESKTALQRAARLGNGWHSAGTSLADLPEKIGVIREALAAAGRRDADFVLSTFPTDRLTTELIGQFAEHGINHMMEPVFSFDANKVKQRLESIAKDVIEPYQHGA